MIKLRNEEKKRLENLRLAKEIENINKVSELNRDKKRLMEKEIALIRLKKKNEILKKMYCDSIKNKGINHNIIIKQKKIHLMPYQYILKI